MRAFSTCDEHQAHTASNVEFEILRKSASRLNPPHSARFQLTSAMCFLETPDRAQYVLDCRSLFLCSLRLAGYPVGLAGSGRGRRRSVPFSGASFAGRSRAFNSSAGMSVSAGWFHEAGLRNSSGACVRASGRPDWFKFSSKASTTRSALFGSSGISPQRGTRSAAFRSSARCGHRTLAIAAGVPAA